MFKKGDKYSAKLLSDYFGGNVQYSMPLIDGKVPYCKFDPKINHNMPAEVWIEEGPMRVKGAKYLIETNHKLPVFTKESVNNWKYIGRAKFVNVSNTEKLNDINKNPPRNRVVFILKLIF